MPRISHLPILLCLTGCVFGGGDIDENAQPGDTGSTADAATDMGDERDQGPASDLGNDSGAPDLGSMDLATPDAEPPVDMFVDMGPPDRPISAVCDGTPTSDLSGASRFRIRVASNLTDVWAGYIVPNDNAWLHAHTRSQWETSPGWVRANPIAGVLSNFLELEESNVTGIAILPRPGSRTTDLLVTRIPEVGDECLYGERNLSALSYSCDGAWGAEVTNAAVEPRYFWFGSGGTIGSTAVDDFSPTSSQIIVPWCAQNPDDPTACLNIDFRATDARGNRGPNVLLSDAEGRAYLWDTVQNIDGTLEAIDCTTPPTAPVPLTLQGNPVMFANADVVRLDDGSQYLVRQTDALVALHPLDSALQPMAAIEEIPNTGLRPHFDATSDGTRIAAVAAANSDIRVFAFNATTSMIDTIIDDDPNITIHAAGATIIGDQVAVMAGHSGFRFVSANAFQMWGN